MKHKQTNPLHIKTNDHFLTKKPFSIYRDQKTNVLYTYPVAQNLDEYYKSDRYHSHSVEAKNWFEVLYMLSRKYRTKKKLSLIKQHCTGKRILDIGCGTGGFLKLAQLNQLEVDGIENNKKANEKASRSLNQKVFADLPSISYTKKNYNAVTLWHVLEHLPNIQNQIEQIHSLLDKNGVLFIAVPNHESFDAKYYKEYWAAYDVPRHLWHFTPTSLKTILIENGFEIIQCKPQYMDSLYVSILSEQYKGGLLPTFRGLTIGMLSNILSLITKKTSSFILIAKKSI